MMYHGLDELASELTGELAAGAPLGALIDKAVLLGYRHAREHQAFVRMLIAGVVDAGALDASQRPTFDIPADPIPPELTVTTPERGAVEGASTITVSGIAYDDVDLAGVSINGVAAALDGDRFTAEIALAPGTNLIETVATDAAGNQARRSPRRWPRRSRGWRRCSAASCRRRSG